MINSTLRRNTHSGDGALLAFPYTFRIISDTHLLVTVLDAMGSGTVQSLGTDYTVNGVRLENGGYVNMVVAPAIGETLVIERVLELTQDTDLKNAGTYLPESVEDALDALVAMMQQIGAAAASASGVQTFTAGTQPGAGADWRGKIIEIKDAGQGSVFKVCGLKPDGVTYTWQPFAEVLF